jgi:hypothetical protein
MFVDKSRIDGMSLLRVEGIIKLGESCAGSSGSSP